jgi:hypothetical protein
MPKRTSTTNYRRNRAQVLAGNPTCHWCKRKPAVEADHLIEHDRGGSDEVDNLVPSCKTCNSKRGQAYLEAKNRTRQALRARATSHAAEPETFLDSHPPRPRRPSFFVSEGKPKEVPGTGHDLPRLETTVPDAVGTYGPAVAEWASSHLSIDLMPWQRHVLDQQLSYDANGDWCHALSLVSVARQNGKTVALAALIGWLLTEYPVIVKRPITVVSTAHRLDLATSLFQDLAPILEAKFGAKAVWAYSRNSLTLGQTKWVVKAARPSAGHGMSVDFLIIDEVWGIDSDTLDIGLLPTQRARPNPLCSMWSTAGTEESVAMLRHRETAIRAMDTGESSPIYLAEYSPPPELDPMTPEAWAYANPALGRTLTAKVLQRESTAPNRAGFLRSSVNVWCQTDAGWLLPGQFDKCRTDLPPLPGGVLACEVSIDDGRYVAVRANANAEGVTTCTVAFMADTREQFWDQVRRQLADNPGVALYITPTLDTHCPTDLTHRRTIWGYQEITRYTGAVKQMIVERRLAHTGETMLAEHCGRAVAVKTPGSIAISSNKSPGPVELARCLVIAAALAAKPTSNVRRPVIATSMPRRVA